ncbi:hypothetical protein Esti_006861 [Eimeria stiedai]
MPGDTKGFLQGSRIIGCLLKVSSSPLLPALSCCFGVVRMIRVTSSATYGPVDLESNSDLLVSSGKNHGSTHTDCLRGGSSSKGKAGASGIHGSSFLGLKSRLPIQLLVVGLLLTISFCIQRRRRPLRKGMQRRRLADGGEESEDTGDVTGPSSPDLIDLCFELGAWTPSDPLPGNPRSSPVTVESYFTSLDQSSEQPVAQTSRPAVVPGLKELLPVEPSAGKKRSLDDDDSDDESAPGPSRKVLRTRAASAAGQGSSSQLVIAASTSALPSLGEAAPVSSGPAAGVAPSQALGSGPPSHHLFVRRPTLEPGVRPREFLATAIRSAHLAPGRYVDTMKRMRVLLRQSHLSGREAQDLVLGAEELARYAFHCMSDEVEELRPVHAAARLGRKFLVIYYLFSASQVLGQGWPTRAWWRELMDSIPHRYQYSLRQDRRVGVFNALLANDLSSAITQLKSGVCPGGSVIIDLKKRRAEVIFDKVWSTRVAF